MSSVRIHPKNLNGTVEVPPSKSYLHRAIICGTLSGKSIKISPVIYSDDVLATINSMKCLGADIDIFENSIKINGFIPSKNSVKINCLDSGSTLRFLIPLVAALGIQTTFLLGESLAKRPILPYLESLSDNGLKFEFNGDFELIISGKLSPGKFFIPGKISSQFISGLMMALPILQSDSEIILTSDLESCSYVDMTIDVMKKFGVTVTALNQRYHVPCPQKYIGCDFSVEGDWSQAAFFLVAGAIGGNIVVKNLKINSTQGDRAIIEILDKMGAKIEFFESCISIHSGDLKGTIIDAKNIPDLVPITCVAAVCAEGTTKIHNVKRLKFKECNRLSAICQELEKLGADINAEEDCIIINGHSNLHSDHLWSHNDHRILMSLAIMATKNSGITEIADINCVKKSYPNFFEIFKQLGGVADVIDMGK